uniref:OCRE domain-containing protein n=1 Tax=Acrobeloides nanus TaxID=290746 RepID=A0A914BV43_9BILA
MEVIEGGFNFEEAKNEDIVNGLTEPEVQHFYDEDVLDSSTKTPPPSVDIPISTSNTASHFSQLSNVLNEDYIVDFGTWTCFRCKHDSPNLKDNCINCNVSKSYSVENELKQNGYLSENPTPAMIFCGIPANTTKEDVLIAMKQYSGQDKYVPTEVFISELKPFCLVEMNDEKEAAYIMTIIIRNGVEIRGCQVTASYSEKSYLQSVVEEKMQKLQSQPKQIPPTASITVPISPPEFLVNEILQKEQELKRREEQLELKRKANEEALARAKKKSFSPSNKIDLSKHLESSSSVYERAMQKAKATDAETISTQIEQLAVSVWDRVSKVTLDSPIKEIKEERTKRKSHDQQEPHSSTNIEKLESNHIYKAFKISLHILDPKKPKMVNVRVQVGKSHGFTNASIQTDEPYFFPNSRHHSQASTSTQDSRERSITADTRRSSRDGRRRRRSRSYSRSRSRSRSHSPRRRRDRSLSRTRSDRRREERNRKEDDDLLKKWSSAKEKEAEIDQRTKFVDLPVEKRKIYSKPEPTEFIEHSSGYYLDRNTGFFYDPCTDYFYDPGMKCWLFWSQTYTTYIPCDGGDYYWKKKQLDKERKEYSKLFRFLKKPDLEIAAQLTNQLIQVCLDQLHQIDNFAAKNPGNYSHMLNDLKDFKREFTIQRQILEDTLHPQNPSEVELLKASGCVKPIPQLAANILRTAMEMNGCFKILLKGKITKSDCKILEAYRNRITEIGAGLIDVSSRVVTKAPEMIIENTSTPTKSAPLTQAFTSAPGFPISTSITSPSHLTSARSNFSLPTSLPTTSNSTTWIDNSISNLIATTTTIPMASNDVANTNMASKEDDSDLFDCAYDLPQREKQAESIQPQQITMPMRTNPNVPNHLLKPKLISKVDAKSPKEPLIPKLNHDPKPSIPKPMEIDVQPPEALVPKPVEHSIQTVKTKRPVKQNPTNSMTTENQANNKNTQEGPNGLTQTSQQKLNNKDQPSSSKKPVQMVDPSTKTMVNAEFLKASSSSAPSSISIIPNIRTYFEKAAKKARDHEVKEFFQLALRTAGSEQQFNCILLAENPALRKFISNSPNATSLIKEIWDLVIAESEDAASKVLLSKSATNFVENWVKILKEDMTQVTKTGIKPKSGQQNESTKNMKAKKDPPIITLDSDSEESDANISQEANGFNKRTEKRVKLEIDASSSTMESLNASKRLDILSSEFLDLPSIEHSNKPKENEANKANPYVIRKLDFVAIE